MRFRLVEISVPPGSATIELLGAMAPGLADTLIAWMTTAGKLLSQTLPAKTPKRRRPPRRK